MTEHVFLSVDGRVRATWQAAFPDAVFTDALADGPHAESLWLLKPVDEPIVQTLARIPIGRRASRLVMMSDVPNDEEGLAALAAGAAGYCNGHAAAEVLQQIAGVVRNGGVWVGQSLLQRLLASTARVLPPDSGAPVWAERLTQREQETAHLIAKGASNKEIARTLDITERTVKAHVGALLEKLGARDRLQLALIVNGVDRRA